MYCGTDRCVRMWRDIEDVEDDTKSKTIRPSTIIMKGLAYVDQLSAVEGDRRHKNWCYLQMHCGHTQAEGILP